MTLCKDCNRDFKNLKFHHDPPKSKIFQNEGWGYFIDRDGQKKLVITNNRNRKLCKECHLKADRKWGCRLPKFLKKAERYNKLYIKEVKD